MSHKLIMIRADEIARFYLTQIIFYGMHLGIRGRAVEAGSSGHISETGESGRDQ